MEKTFENNVHTGYTIGNSISVHWHISDPDSWFLTIRTLQIYGFPLCKKSCTESEIARYINVILQSQKSVLNGLIEDIIQLT